MVVAHFCLFYMVWSIDYGAKKEVKVLQKSFVFHHDHASISPEAMPSSFKHDTQLQCVHSPRAAHVSDF